ncbi:SRPBCC family protein [Salipiger sp.]|uniref:SRPBCC family protein n=1 Tax=Salipiger sp. TaxID=2078585 RepID=UPI003A979782
MSAFNPETDLKLERFIKARPETVWRCWEEPDLFRQWFCPKPVEVTEIDHDMRAGGRAYTVMKLPDGTLMPNDGSFLLVEKPNRLIFTDALLAGFRPVSSPFMVADIRYTAQDGGTLYTAHVMHPDAAKRDEHDKMGFQEGWGTVAGQLAELAESLE